MAVTEKRWAWWGQARDIAALVAGTALLASETVRGTYDTAAMMFSAACFGIVSTGVLGRYLAAKLDEEGK